MDELAEDARRGIDVSSEVDKVTTSVLSHIDLERFPRVVGLTTAKDILFSGCVADHGIYDGVTKIHDKLRADSMAVSKASEFKNAHRLRLKTSAKFFHKTVKSFRHDERRDHRKALSKCIYDITKGYMTFIVLNVDALPFFGRGSHHRNVPLKKLLHKIRFESDNTAIVVFVGAKKNDLVFDTVSGEPLRFVNHGASLQTHNGAFRSPGHILSENTLTAGLDLYRRALFSQIRDLFHRV